LVDIDLVVIFRLPDATPGHGSPKSFQRQSLRASFASQRCLASFALVVSFVRQYMKVCVVAFYLSLFHSMHYVVLCNLLPENETRRQLLFQGYLIDSLQTYNARGRGDLVSPINQVYSVHSKKKSGTCYLNSLPPAMPSQLNKAIQPNI
jgi:hypothetical protein